MTTCSPTRSPSHLCVFRASTGIRTRKISLSKGGLERGGSGAAAPEATVNYMVFMSCPACGSGAGGGAGGVGLSGAGFGAGLAGGGAGFAGSAGAEGCAIAGSGGGTGSAGIGGAVTTPDSFSLARSASLQAASGATNESATNCGRMSFTSFPFSGDRQALNGRTRPSAPNAITSNGWMVPSGTSIPGDPSGIPATAIPRISAGRSASSRSTSSIGTWPSTA